MLSACFSSGAALSALLLAACAGNGEGLDANGRPIVPGGSGGLPLSADFESLQENIFTPICSVCHAGAAAPQGLRLDAANSYNLLVGVPSTEVPSILRVKPSDPDSSYIIQKLEGHAAVGAQMPLGGPYLSTATIGFIREWITNGAQPATAAASTASFAITGIVPDDKETVAAAPPQIMVAFNHDLDASQIGTYVVHIEKLETGSATGVLTRMPARVAVSSANLHVLMIWPSRPLSAGHYRVVMDAAASGHFSDVAGRTVAAGIPDELGEPVVANFDVEEHP
jgi:methionine-rich copper-binding protein CopC